MHILASFFSGLAHRIGDGIGFANANAHPATVITNDDGHAEGEVATAFDNFGNSGDLNHTLVNILVQIQEFDNLSCYSPFANR